MTRSEASQPMNAETMNAETQILNAQPENKKNEAESQRSRNILSLPEILRLCFVMLAIYTTVCFFARWFWLADLAISFRVQATVFALLLFVACLMLRNLFFISVGLLFLVIHLTPVLPYVTPTLFQTNRGRAVRFMSVNLLSENQRHDAFVSLVSKCSPDLIAVLEVNQRWETELRKLNDVYPFQYFASREDNFGIAILSKFPLSDPKLMVSIENDPPWLHCKVQIDEISMEVIAIHPMPPLSPNLFWKRNQQLVKAASQFTLPTNRIMLGDFNMTPWSPGFADVLAAGDIKDASRSQSVAGTWYPYNQFLVGLKLDHILISSDLNVGEFTVSDAFYSDHRAVVAEIWVER